MMAVIITIGIAWIVVFMTLWYIQRRESKNYYEKTIKFCKILQTTIINHNIFTIEQKKMMKDIVKTLIEKFPESKELIELHNSLYKL